MAATLPGLTWHTADVAVAEAFQPEIEAILNALRGDCFLNPTGGPSKLIFKRCLLLL